MHFRRIEFVKKAEFDREKIESLLWEFAFGLECSGQILRDYKITKKESYNLYVTLPHEDSFDEIHDNDYVKSHREELLKYFNMRIFGEGINLESKPYCKCKNRSAIEMQTFSLDIDSVFSCCDCGMPIALYELPFPAENQNTYDWVESWQTNFSSMDKLWWNCLCDRYTGNQRVKPDSALNKQGIEIARYMSKELKIPVYYHLASDYGKSVKIESVDNTTVHVCPICQKKMTPVTVSENYKIDVCNECNLSYDQPSDY